MDRAVQTADVRRRGRRSWVVGFLVVLAIVFVTIFRNPLFNNNIGVVYPGRVYRSAQPEANLRTLVDRYGVATILNLRGGTFADPFYANEVGVSRERGIDFYDLPMSATRRPTRGELLRLIDLLTQCRYPLLIHCKSGSDRTGLVSALYLMTLAGKPPSAAIEAFSVYYGHLPVGGTARLHEPFVEYDRWLAAHGSPHTPGLFRWWVENIYTAPGESAAIPPLRPGPRGTVEGTASR